MSSTRRFLLAPSLARLIEKERSVHQLTEGFFPETTARSICVRVGDGANHLILVEDGSHSNREQLSTLPASHALALLDYTAHRVEYHQATLAFGSLTISVHRLTKPAPIDIATIEFQQKGQANAFPPPLWFGPEVTGEPAFHYRRMAFDGLPEWPEVEATNMALDSLLDVLQEQETSPHADLIAPHPSREALASNNKQVFEIGNASSEDTGSKATDSESETIRKLAHSLRPRLR